MSKIISGSRMFILSQFHSGKLKYFSLNHKTFSSKVKLDPYLILDINRQADWKTIKKAYFRLARLYHPDLNKNDELAQKKFLQVKEAYEYFERKYVPEKYINNRQNFSSKFEEDSQSEEKTENEFESIREKKKRNSKQQSTKDDSKQTPHDFQFSKDDLNESNTYFTDEAIKNELEKKKNIEKFLFLGIPMPRSPKMVDRLKMKQLTIGKGKALGPEDYFSFTLITTLIILFVMERMRQYKSYDIENLENVNIYNALKPSEVLKIYEDNQVSPTEQLIINSKEHQDYKEKQKNEEMLNKIRSSTYFERINDVPKLDIKKKFNESISNKK